MGGSRARRRAHTRPVATVALTALVGVGLAWGLAHLGSDSRSTPPRPASLTASGAGPAPPSPTSSAAPSPSPAAAAKRRGVVAEAPLTTRLPGGTIVRVAAVSSRANGLLDVPDDIRVAGWWRGGSRLGDPFGSTLIAAHVDSTTQGLGPYAELLSVRAGAQVVVRSRDLTQTFRVISLRLVPQDGLAAVPEIFSPSGPRRLTLVTCAGPYDRRHGGYQNLAVVTARPAGEPTRIRRTS